METSLILLIIGVIVSVLGLPFTIICIYLLIKYQKQEFVRIRGLKNKYFLLIPSILLLHIFVPFTFTYQYIISNNNSSSNNTNANSVDKINEYFLLIYQTLFFAFSIPALIQRFYHFSKFKLMSSVSLFLLCLFVFFFFCLVCFLDVSTDLDKCGMLQFIHNIFEMTLFATTRC